MNPLDHVREDVLCAPQTAGMKSIVLVLRIQT